MRHAQHDQKAANRCIEYVPRPDFLSLAIVNFLLAVLTLGIAAPYIRQRRVRCLRGRITVDGTVNIDRIMQSRAPIGTAGEGLADAFDVSGL